MITDEEISRHTTSVTVNHNSITLNPCSLVNGPFSFSDPSSYLTVLLGSSESYVNEEERCIIMYIPFLLRL